MAAVVEYLEGVDPAAAHAARRAYSCFDPYHDDAQAYAQATAFVPTSCEDATVAMLQKLRQQAATFEEDGRDSYFSAEQNALVARNAERYYRAMIRGGSSSWNVRDTHMLETLDRLVTHHAPRPKAIVWAHNTHIGDARFTDMARHGMVNLGQLVRQARGDGPDDRDGVMLVGFGTHRGSVIASEEWGAPMQRLPVPPARDGSWEDLLHQSSEGDRLFVFDGSDDGGIPGLGQAVDHRAVGVVYHPDAERWGNYVPSIIPRRYDAFMFIDESRALEPLHMPAILGADMPETYPTGM
jgi:erythromycin esterase-like protein